MLSKIASYSEALKKTEAYLGVVLIKWCILFAHREAARRHLLLQSIRPTWPDTSHRLWEKTKITLLGKKI